MGLLDQILGGVLGRSAGGGAMGGGLGRGTPGGGVLGSVLMSLLPVVLGMLVNRGTGSRRGLTSEPGAGDSNAMGGLGGLLEQFTQKGYGDHARSWVGTGANEALTPEALSHVFGDEQLADIASQAGVSQEEARHGLSELLPEVVDHFTPQGHLPPADQLLASIDEYQRRLPQ
ncbi:MAG: YidB family protein [Caldimonas sp.]